MSRQAVHSIHFSADNSDLIGTSYASSPPSWAKEVWTLITFSDADLQFSVTVNNINYAKGSNPVSTAAANSQVALMNLPWIVAPITGGTETFSYIVDVNVTTAGEGYCITLFR